MLASLQATPRFYLAAVDFYSYEIKSGSGLGVRLSVCEVQHLCVHPREVTWFLVFTGRHSC